MNTFLWLVKREFWEHRGGFLRAPVITAAIFLVLNLMGIVTGEVMGRQMGFHLGMGSNNLHLLTQDLDQRSMEAVGAGLDLVMYSSTMIIGIVLGFVVFFYCLGALYDDRRDRSILFWKSLPVSDTATVLSKATWALLLAPIVSIVAGVVIGVVLWIIAGASLAAAGLPGATAVFTHAHPFGVIGNQLTMIPAYLLWALPAVGWLMLCSAWARSKPFLWAVLLPILACVMVSMAGVLPGMDINYGQVWYTLVYRGLLSVVPGAWLPASSAFEENMHNSVTGDIQGPADLMHLMNVSSLDVLASPDLWIGAVIGVAFIATSIYLRRWRELAD